MKTDAEVLDTMMEILTPETWIKGTLCAVPGQPYRDSNPQLERMCLSGAVVKALYGKVSGTAGWDDISQEQEVQRFRILNYFCQAIKQHHEGSSGTIPSFNDLDTTTYDDVYQLMKQVREGLE